MSAPLLQVVPGTSRLHVRRPDLKILCISFITMSIAFSPGWLPLGVAMLGALTAMRVAALPKSVIPRPPRIFVFGMLGGLIGSSLSGGGGPTIAGVEIGGMLDFFRFVAFSVTLIFYGGLLSWTTELHDLGAGLGRIIRPLRFLKVPVDELTTVLALAVRAVPLVIDELRTVADARQLRPLDQAHTSGSWSREAVDLGTVVVVGAHRRARDMARAMTVRDSTVAPAAHLRRFNRGDAVLVGATAIVVLLINVLP